MKHGWEINKLGDVCDLLNRGISPKYSEKDGICVLNQKCIRNHRVNYEESRRHDSSLKAVNPERLIKVGDVLVNSTGTGTLGRVAQIREIPIEPTTVDSHVTIVRPKDSLFYPDFFGYMLILIEEKIKEAGEGCGGQTELARSVLAEKFLVQYPISIPEQQRIVAILDEAFEAIATAKANAEQNLKNAKELFESYLHGVFENKGEGWKEMTLGDIAFVKSGGTPSRAKKEYWEGEIAWYSSGELNDLYTKEPERHINELAINNSNAKIFPKGSLLIGMYDTAALKMSIIDRDATFNQAIAGVKPNDKIDLTFVLHSINSIKPELLNLRRGVRQKNLSLEKIKNIPIYLPSLKVQQTIVTKLDALSVETKRLEAIYQQKIADLEELKKSVLQKAFNGELKTNYT